MVNKLSAAFALLGVISAALAVAPKNAIEHKLQRTTISSRELAPRDTNPQLLYPAYHLSVPIDHFHNDSLYEPHSDGTFNLRYWFDATYYQPGGPVIVLQSGETSGVDRLAFLQKGLLHQMAVATNGIGVVLEHRYYGTSMPTADLSTESLRFLTTAQALADQAYFAQNVVFAGYEDLDLTAPNVAYIAYGGSYAGAFVAFLRKLYPDVFWGTISSSGVIKAIYDYWAYYEPVRMFADQSCISNIGKITNVVDNILIGIKDTTTTAELKAAWGMPNVTLDADFASVISWGLLTWQSRNWDPALNDPTFDDFCNTITANSTLYPTNQGLTSTVKDLLTKGGYGDEVASLTTPFLNWIGWIGDYTVNQCQGDQDECYGTSDPYFYALDDIKQTWRAWPYQYCTEWGYLVTGSGVPKDKLSLTTRLGDIAYNSIICEQAFNITTPPNTDLVNQYGGYSLSYPRLAMIDGDRDPWRPATAHASPFTNEVDNRTNTVSEPFILIDNAVHHWDENGLFPNQTTDSLPPQTVKDAQAQEIVFVLEWMQEWEQHMKEKRFKVAAGPRWQKPW